MDVKFLEMPLSFLRNRLVPMFERAHWEEVGQDKSWEPDLDWDLYEVLAKRGDLSILVLFVDGQPRGYFVGMCGRPSHYRTKWIMRCDMFYIEPGYRQFAVRLFRAAKAFAKLHGAQKLYVSWKVYKDIEPILRRIGAVTIEKMAVADLG